MCILCTFTVYGTLFSPPVAETCATLAGNLCQYLTRVMSGANNLVRSAFSQLASRVGEGGEVGQICLHSVTQPYTTWPRWREQGGGLCSLPLGLPGCQIPVDPAPLRQVGHPGRHLTRHCKPEPRIRSTTTAAKSLYRSIF